MYKDQELYGKVEYFLVYEYHEERYMLAYVQWTSDVHIDRYCIKSFRGFSTHDFIEVEYIDRCVGFIRIDDKFYIFDRENQVIYNE